MINQAMSFTDWMSKLDENTRMIDVAIPGTHQSLSYLCQSFEDWVPYSRTQNGTIIQQLNDGIRFFDMRLDYNCDWLGNNCDVVTLQGNIHCGRTVTNFTKIINDIGEWLRAHTREILIIYISTEGNTAKRVCRDDTIKYLGDKLVWANMGITPANTLKEIRQHGTVFVIAHKNDYQMDGVGREFFSDDYLWSPFTDDSADDINMLTKFLSDNYSNKTPNNSNALTCMPAYAFWSSLQATSENIERNSRELNPQLITNITNKVITPPKLRGKFNIIACDFYEYGNFNTFVIKMNVLSTSIANQLRNHTIQPSSNNHHLIILIIVVSIIVFVGPFLLFLYIKHKKQ